MTIIEEPIRNPAPVTPRHLPVEIAPETWVIQATQGEGTSPMAVHMNAMVIRGREPIVVDTGCPGNRERYFEDLFGIVDPDDVRWVFISHDDVDHYGNLDAVMSACPNATLVASWFLCERLQADGLEMAPAAVAVGRPRRVIRRRRPHPRGGPTSPLRLTHHAWTVRSHHRRLLGLGLLRHAGAAGHGVRGGARPRCLGRGVHRFPALEQSLGVVARGADLRQGVRTNRAAPAPSHRDRPRADHRGDRPGLAPSSSSAPCPAGLLLPSPTSSSSTRSSPPWLSPTDLPRAIGQEDARP